MRFLEKVKGCTRLEDLKVELNRYDQRQKVCNSRRKLQEL